MTWEIEYVDEFGEWWTNVLNDAERESIFDPRRMAILLLGGDKTRDDGWYDREVPRADRLYDQHLKELREEGLL